MSSIALLTTHSLNVIGAQGSAQADPSQPVIEGMGLAPAIQPLRTSGLKSTDFSVNPDQDSENALPDPVSIKAFYSSSEPLVVSEWYSATQFIIRETALQSGSEFMISPPDFSAHGLQATDATLPNYVSVDIDGDAQEEANSMYRIARSADSGTLIVTLLRDLAIESPFEVTYQNVIRSTADLAPLTLPLAYRKSEGSIWHPINVEAKTLLPGEPTRLAISAPTKASRSEPFNIAIVAMDQFGHPADRQPRSLDLRSERKLIGRISPDAETGLLSSEQTVNELTVTRFEARSPGGGLRGVSNWIDVQRTSDRQLLWTDFSLDAMRALPSIPFSAVEPFKGDDQLGAALTRQIVPTIDIPEPSTEALPVVGAPNPASGFNAAAIGDFGERAVEAESAGFADRTERLSSLGLVKLETDANSEVGPEPFALGDQLSGRSSAQERANSASTDGSLAVSEQASATPEIGIDADGVLDQEPALNRDSDATTPLAGTLADHSTSPRAVQSIQGTTEVADAVGQDAAYPFASSGQAGTNASIQAIEPLPSKGTDNSNSIPAVNQTNVINQHDKGSLDNISQNLTEDLEGTINPEIQSRAVSMLRKWEAPRTGGETAYLHMDHPDYAWRIARPEATSDSRIGQYRGAVVLQGASAYPWMIDYNARRGEVFAILSDRVSATGDALATGPHTGIWMASQQPWLVGFLNGQTVVTKGHQWPFRFTVNGGQGRVPHEAERRLAADFLSNESIVWIDWYKNGQRLRRQYDPERPDMPNSVSRPEAASRYSSWDLMIAFESSSAPIAPGFTAPRNRREWLGYAAFDAEQYTMKEVAPLETDASMKSLLSDDGQRVDFLTSTHGAPSLIRIRSREFELADTAESNDDESSNPDAERSTSEPGASEPVIDTLTIALAEGFEDGLFFDENRLPQPTPGAVFSIPLEDLKIGPVTREFEVKGYRDRITVMLMAAQPSSDAEKNLDRKPIRRAAELVDRSEPKPGDYYWSHALLADGTALWSSPVFVGGYSVNQQNRSAEPSPPNLIDQTLEAD